MGGGRLGLGLGPGGGKGTKILSSPAFPPPSLFNPPTPCTIFNPTTMSDARKQPARKRAGRKNLARSFSATSLIPDQGGKYNRKKLTLGNFAKMGKSGRSIFAKHGVKTRFSPSPIAGKLRMPKFSTSPGGGEGAGAASSSSPSSAASPVGKTHAEVGANEQQEKTLKSVRSSAEMVRHEARKELARAEHAEIVKNMKDFVSPREGVEFVDDDG